MRELGLYLREKRESAGLDLDALHAKTKIRKRYLIALEEGDWSVLPGEVYARGFVRSYAEALGLDGLQLLVKYVDSTPQSATSGMSPDTSTKTVPISEDSSPSKSSLQSGSAQKVSDRPTALVSSQSGRAHNTDSKGRSPQTKLLATRRFTGGSQVAVVVGVLIVIAGGWILLKNSGTHPGQSSNLVGNIAGTQNATATGSGSQGGTNGSPVNNASDNFTSNGTSSASSTQITTAPFQNLQQSYTVTSSQPLTVNLTAMNQDCWIKVTADGAVVDANDTLLAGQTKAWTANQTLLIRLGHVSGMTLQIDGQQVVLPNTQNAIDVVIQKSPS